MLSSIPSVDLSPLLQFVFTALVLGLGLLYIVKTTASRYFDVDARFDGGRAAVSDDRSVPSGPVFSDQRPTPDAVAEVCIVCGKRGGKQCSRCKAVRYCSTTCQSNHWKDHKSKCKEFKLLDKADSLSSPTSGSSSGRRKASLVPAHGTCKVLRQPKEVLFPYEEFVKLFYWETSGFPPCGLLNCGNSCFANVVLQCLACTRPLVAYLMEKGHSRKCSRNDWCFLCEFQSHIHRVTQSLQPFSPINILSRLPNIGGNLGYGKQEDAHEFMRFAIDTMQSICLDEFGGEKALDLSTQETTLIQHIFGGHLQSQVICTKCDKVSYRYENMMDLTVEIQGDVASLEDCLDRFTVKEKLDGENMYKCDGCNDYVRAWKRLTIHRAPNILTIALKRFQSGRFGKLNKRVTFPETLDLGPYMSEAGDGTDVYNLYAVVVHVDMLNASFFGHYICYTKDFSGNWYRIDDCKVMLVELEEVLGQGAYMLLYSRIRAQQPRVKSLEHSRKAEREVLEVAKEVLGSRESVEPVGIAVSHSVTTPGCPSSDASQQSMDSGHGREIDSRTHRKEPLHLNLVDTVEIPSVPSREDCDGVGLCSLQSSASGPRDLDKGSLTQSSLVEDSPSAEFIRGEPTNSVSSIEQTFGAAALDSQEPGSNFVECQGKEENGIWNHQDKEFKLDPSSDDSITNGMAETSVVATTTFLAHEPRELLSTFFPAHSEPKSEHVISCCPSISSAGLGNSKSNGFVESNSARNSTNGRNLSISPPLNEDEAARKGLGTVDIACNGCTSSFYPHENGSWVVSHNARAMAFCRNCEDTPLEFEKPLSYDENAKNPPEVAPSCKLNPSCNGHVHSVTTDQNVGRICKEDGDSNGAFSDSKDPLLSSYSHKPRENFH